MNVMDKIKKLEKEKQDLVKQAKAEALGRAKQAVKDLQDLGFDYNLVEGNGATAATAPTKAGAKSKTTANAKTTKNKRRKGLRDEVMKVIRASNDGMSRGEIIVALNAMEKSDKIAVSNALSALKKSEEIALNNGTYSAA